MKPRFVRPELAYQFMAEQTSVEFPIVAISTSLKEDGVYGKLTIEQLPCFRFKFTDDEILLTYHNNPNIHCPIDISVDAWQRFLAHVIGKDYTDHLFMVEENQHEQNINRILAIRDSITTDTEKTL